MQRLDGLIVAAAVIGCTAWLWFGVGAPAARYYRERIAPPPSSGNDRAAISSSDPQPLVTISSTVEIDRFTTRSNEVQVDCSYFGLGNTVPRLATLGLIVWNRPDLRVAMRATIDSIELHGLGRLVDSVLTIIPQARRWSYAVVTGTLGEIQVDVSFHRQGLTAAILFEGEGIAFENEGQLRLFRDFLFSAWTKCRESPSAPR